jgi:hypothetical protein
MGAAKGSGPMTPSAKENLLTAWNQLQTILEAMPADPPARNAAAVAEMNKSLAAHRKFFDALRNADLAIVADVYEDKLRSGLEQSMRRAPDEISIGERRALVAAALYRAGYCLPNSGERDAPMQRAMMATSLFIDTIAELGEDFQDADFEATFLRLYREIIESDRDDFETVKKSITRFKAGLEHDAMVRFDSEALEFRLVSFQDAAHGLKRRPGRPPKRR